MKSVTLGLCLLVMIIVGAVTQPMQANECDKQTFPTFSAPVVLPGRTLPAGTYQFTHPDCSTSGHILRVSSPDGAIVYAILLVNSEDRPLPSDQALVVFAEMSTGAPEAIKAWFYPGEPVGDELIYSKGEASRVPHASERAVLATDRVR
jgi:hypothetical protein